MALPAPALAVMEAWEALVTGAAWEPLLLPLAVAAAGWLGCVLALWLVARTSKRADSDVGQWLVKFLRRPLQLLAATVLFRLTLPVATLSGGLEETVRHILAILLILGTGWLLIALTSVLDEFIDKRFVIEIRDNLTARRMHTKFLVLRRVLVIIVCVITGGALLMTFPAIRQLGAGLLASAGIVGIVLGIAARPTVETLIAGVQLALTEPIRLDDVVVVEGEWGRIEEINATHVAIRIWDDRRLIVPVSYFLTQPFQNWTRVTADVTGQVTLEVGGARRRGQDRRGLSTLGPPVLEPPSRRSWRADHPTPRPRECRRLFECMGPPLRDPREAHRLPPGATPGGAASTPGGSRRRPDARAGGIRARVTLPPQIDPARM
jgi:small-conductance mechanosensitive channel